MIGSHIRELREDKGYILRQMAALLDIDPTILSKMERGERAFKKDNIERIAEICKVDKKELITIWLADKVKTLIQNEEYALDAVKLVTKQLSNEI